MNFFTSDLHINHSRILQYCSRPFSSVEEMNAKMIERWNETVGIDDTVYVVGDMFLGKPEDAKPIISGLNGYKILILGNVCVDLWDYRPITEDELCAVKLSEAGYDEVEVRLNGEMIEVKATIRKEDIDGLLDHLHVFSSTIWNTRKEG